MTGRGDFDIEAIARCVEYCARNVAGTVILAIPKVLPSEVCADLLAKANVAGVVLPEGAVARREVGRERIGRFLPALYQWELPACRAGTVVFFGPRANLSFRMARAALMQGRWWVMYMAPGRWRRELLVAFLLRRVGEKLQSLLEPRLRSLLKAIPSRRGAQPRPIPRPAGFRGLERNMRMALSAAGVPLLPASAFQAGRVLLVNSSLAWGGAERQIVNTLLGLKGRGVANVGLLVEHLHDRPEHDFYLWQLQQQRIPVRQVRHGVYPSLGDQQEVLTEQLQLALSSLPTTLADEICYYALEFADARPAIVHAWQDSTSIKVGLAAALIGVPRIVLGSRNMAPIHFNYHLPYMRPGYRVLAGLPQVTLLNNSIAGARDYAQWLNLPPARYRVLFNGMRSDLLERATPAEIAAYRERLGIPAAVRIVGSIFRFYAEKDPLLWVETVAKVAATRKDCAFLLIGTGVMQDELVAKACALGVADRIFMPGTEKNPALPLSAMDVFLLTSHLEGTPNVVIEAQWLGVPVVATSAGGTADTLDPGRSGWVLDSRSPDDLAARILNLLDNEAARLAAGAHAREFARARFGMDRMIDETVVVYGMSRNGAAAVAADKVG